MIISLFAHFFQGHLFSINLYSTVNVMHMLLVNSVPLDKCSILLAN